MMVPARERGLTMTGFLFVAVVVLVLALVCFRVIPAYIEYFSVQKALEGALVASKDLTKADIKNLVSKRIDADYIESINAGDIDVTKSGNVTTVSVSWQTKLHMVGNASIVLDFDASASR
jgi:hypothetical protein